MDKAVVAVLFGGRSSEHSISSATAGGVLRAIDRGRFDVIPIGITRDGAFILEDDDPAPGDRRALDPLLERDTAPIGDLPLCRALLINDANYPWLLLVPRREGGQAWSRGVGAGLGHPMRRRHRHGHDRGHDRGHGRHGWRRGLGRAGRGLYRPDEGGLEIRRRLDRRHRGPADGGDAPAIADGRQDLRHEKGGCAGGDDRDHDLRGKPPPACGHLGHDARCH